MKTLLLVIAALLALTACEGVERAPYPVYPGEACTVPGQYGLTTEGRKAICTQRYSPDLRWVVSGG